MEIEKYGSTGTRYANRYMMYGSLKIWGPPRRSQFHPGHGGPPIEQYMLHAGILDYVATARGDLPRRTLSPRDLELSKWHEVALEVARGPWRSAKRLLANGGEGGRDRDLPEGGAVLIRVRIRLRVRVRVTVTVAVTVRRLLTLALALALALTLTLTSSPARPLPSPSPARPWLGLG